jgi:prephenate dehydratase
MVRSIAHLGPAGTNAEAAATRYATSFTQQTGQQTQLQAYPTIAQSLKAAALGHVDFAVVPVENSIEGSVTTTLDTLWKFDQLQIQQALTLPIANALLSHAPDLTTLQTIYSHPQALAQCQNWLDQFIPLAQRIPTSSTTEALQHLEANPTAGAIASERAAALYDLPVLANSINDHPDNCTRFWVLSLQPSPGGDHTSLGFIVHDLPGALVKPLQVLAERNLNLSRIESRPTKRSLGDYLFFIDLEADARNAMLQAALAEMHQCTETLKVFGSYTLLPSEALPDAEILKT